MNAALVERAERNLRLMRQDSENGWDYRLADAIRAAELKEQARSPLSLREHECLSYLSRGLEAPQVAHVMGIALETVKRHSMNARRKLRAKNTAHACCEAVRRGYIT